MALLKEDYNKPIFEECRFYDECREFFIKNWYKWDPKIGPERNNRIINFLLEKICYKCRYKYGIKPLWHRKPFNPKEMYFPFK